MPHEPDHTRTPRNLLTVVENPDRLLSPAEQDLDRSREDLTRTDMLRCNAALDRLRSARFWLAELGKVAAVSRLTGRQVAARRRIEQQILQINADIGRGRAAARAPRSDRG